MKNFTDRIDRHVVPRWRESALVAQTREALPLRERPQTVDYTADVARATAELDKSPTPGVAADALSVALLAGDRALADRAKAVLATPDRADLPVRLQQLIADSARGDVADIGDIKCQSTVSRQSIQRIRQILQQYPRNPMLYLDLARHQAILGQREKAGKSVKVALSLAPQHRHVLRAASKFYVAEEQPELAHRLLVRAEATQHDPWLMAAEIATAQEARRAPKFFKRGQALLERRAHKPIHLSELAAAVGTVELDDGKRKLARQSFEIALADPTENALAQVKWAEDRSNQVFSKNGNGAMTMLGAHEAAFIKAYYHQHDIVTAARHSQLWCQDEPFAAVPAIMHSYLLSILDDYNGIIDICDLGLRANPGNSCLLHNRLYAEISLGVPFEGEDDLVVPRVLQYVRDLLSEAHQPGANVPHIFANVGLLLYRAGAHEQGRTAYAQAIKRAQLKGETFSAANAAIFHAREAVLAAAPWAGEVVRQAIAMAGKQPPNSSGLKFYAAKIEALAAKPERAGEILSPASAKEFMLGRRPLKLGVDIKVQTNPDGTMTLVMPQRLR